MAENHKHQKVLKQYQQHKNIILRWENTMSKLEGRKPDKRDFENAPKEVKDAYKNYHKCKKYITKLEDEELKQQKQQASKKSTTPRKIFGGFQSQSFIRTTSTTTTSASSSSSFSNSINNNINRKEFSNSISAPIKKNPIIKTFSQKLFSIPSVDLSKHSKKLLGNKSISNDSVGNDSKTFSSSSSIDNTSINSNNSNNTFEDSNSNEQQQEQHDENIELDTDISQAVLSYFEEQNSSLIINDSSSTTNMDSSSSYFTTDISGIDSSSIENEDFNSSLCSMGENNNNNNHNNTADMNTSTATTATTNFDNSISLDTSDIFTPSSSFITSFSINQVSSNNSESNNSTRQKYGNLLKLNDDDDDDEIDLSFPTLNNSNNKHLSSTVKSNNNNDPQNITSTTTSTNNYNNNNTRRTQKTNNQPMEISISFSDNEDEDDIMTESVKIPTSIFDIDHELNMTNDNNNMTPFNVSPTTTTTTTTTLTETTATTSNTDNNNRKRTSAHAFSPSPEKVQPKKKIFKSDRKGSDKRYSLKSCLTLPMNANKRQRKTNTTKGTSSNNSSNNNKNDDETIGITETENKSLESLKITLNPDSSSPGSFKVKNKSQKHNTTTTSPSTSEKCNNNNEPEKARVTSLRSSRNKTTVTYREEEERTPSPKTKIIKKKIKVVTTSTTKKVTTSKKSISTRKKSESTSAEGSKKPTASAATTSTTANTYDDDYAPEKSQAVKGKRWRRGLMTTKSKIASGRLDDNFVRIDVSKKVFVRGKKKMTGAKMKRLDWKAKKSVASIENKLSKSTCKKCGELGHFAKFCMKDQIDVDVESTNQPNAEIDDSPWPTIAEAAKMAWSKRATGSQDNRSSIYARCDSNMIAQDLEHDNVNSNNNNNEDNNNSFDLSTEDTQASCSSNNNNDNNSNYTMPSTAPVPKFPTCLPSCGPYFDNKTSSDEELDEILEKTVKDVFGYDGFRHGQKETIVRVLKGEPALLISSTGSGKSLCYQLPAYLYSQKYPAALTLCISPLVSLMDDQVEGLPGVLNGIALHCQMTVKKREQYIDQIKNKKAQILLASPEAVASGLFGLLRNGELPPIAFACIDEVHCVSEWSHNFRPTYLELCKILREKLNVQCILGLTATATAQTEASICEHLQIERSTVLRGEIIPRNLNLSISRDQDRDLALLSLLRSERFKNCHSIIVYCTTREQCDRIAVLIRTNIQDIPEFNSVIPIARSRISSNCEVYHSRITAARRRYVQKHFMAGNIRIVVATIAFGMGIDKSDIRAVIHYNMSKTFELYVQEIGRAGRDGLPGECHLFLDNIKGKDLSELKRHIYCNSVDRSIVRSLLRRIFKPCKCHRIKTLLEDTNNTDSDETTPNSNNNKNERCPGHEVAFSSEEVVRDLNIPDENIATLLCYLELDKNRKWIENLPKTYAICKIHSYGGAKLLKEAALKCPPLAVAVALQKEKKKFKDNDVYLEFDIVEAASEVGWSSSIVKKEIKNLEWTPTQFDAHGKAIKYRKSGIMVEFTGLSYRVKAPGDLTDEELDQVLNYLYTVNSEQERTQLYNLYKLYQSFYCVSSPNVMSACDTFNKTHSETLKNSICEYFKQEGSGVPPSWKLAVQGTEKEDDIRRDIGSLLLSQRDTTFTGRSIAKILQGIPTPNFSSDDWGKNRAFWRRYMDVDFHFISKIASEEILKY